MEQNNLSFLDLLNILNLGLQIYDIHLNKDDIIDTFNRLKRIESQNDEIIKLLKEK